ncbi:hypothetical protein ACTXT7_009620 [Hymenolepis weldensis]
MTWLMVRTVLLLTSDEESSRGKALLNYSSNGDEKSYVPLSNTRVLGNMRRENAVKGADSRCSYC